MKRKEVNLFDLVPYISDHITTEKEEELSVIVFPRFRSKFMRDYFTPKNKSPFIRIRLEEHGTAVWDLIDGKCKVMDIVSTLANHFNHEENYEYRIIAFLSQLQKQGFLKYK